MFKRFFYITFLLNQRQMCITHIILIVLIFLYFLAVLMKLGGVIGILQYGLNVISHTFLWTDRSE